MQSSTNPMGVIAPIVSIHGTNLAQLIASCIDHFGLIPIERFALKQIGKRGIVTLIGDAQVTLACPYESTDESSGPALRDFGFRVDDLDVAAKHLNAIGYREVETDDGTWPGGGNFLRMRIPTEEENTGAGLPIVIVQGALDHKPTMSHNLIALPYFVNGLAQIAIVDMNLDRLREIYSDGMGFPLHSPTPILADRGTVRELAAMMPTPTGWTVELSLLSPTDAASNLLKNPLNHIAIDVNDVPAARDRCVADGFEESPGGIRKAAASTPERPRVATFLHPKKGALACGVSIELTGDGNPPE